MMYSESEQGDNKARFMIVFSGINEGSFLERYNNNDTIVSESGVFSLLLRVRLFLGTLKFWRNSES